MSQISCCCHCNEAGKFFDDKTARKELKKYRKKGPSKSTRQLLSFIRLFNVKGKTLLDVGGGIGAIQHELFKDELGRAIQVEASPAYNEMAREQAEGNGNADKLEAHLGDFVELAPELPEADIVTMDRVPCCYPHLEKLIDAAASKCQTCCGVVYPRERWFIKIMGWLGNWIMRLRKNDFRIYIHPEDDVAAQFQKNGFYVKGTSRTFFWKVELYARG